MALKESQKMVSIQDYLEGELHSEIKHEYLGGIVHAMSGGTLDHGRIGGNCMVSLGSSLKGKPCQPFNSDVALKIILPTQIRFYYPDLQIVCESNAGDEQYQDKPVIIIEVLSESTRRIDLGEKRDTYLAIPTLQVLIIIDPDQVFVRLDRRVENNGFLQQTFNELDQVIDLPEVDASLPLADIYDGIKMD
ncbi:Uma2 family endonuclease [Akkermansiaceae bacterium]|nr:Uma2 family endonuclease [Akkermansiaceae bacterium]